MIIYEDTETASCLADIGSQWRVIAIQPIGDCWQWCGTLHDVERKRYVQEQRAGQIVTIVGRGPDCVVLYGKRPRDFRLNEKGVGGGGGTHRHG